MEFLIVEKKLVNIQDRLCTEYGGYVVDRNKSTVSRWAQTIK